MRCLWFTASWAQYSHSHVSCTRWPATVWFSTCSRKSTTRPRRRWYPRLCAESSRVKLQPIARRRDESCVLIGFLPSFSPGTLAAIFNLEQLIDMASIGTLQAYTIVCICVLILRWVQFSVDAITQLSAIRAHVGSYPRTIMFRHSYRYADNKESIQDHSSKSRSKSISIGTWLNFSNTKLPNPDTQYVSRALIAIFSKCKRRLLSLVQYQVHLYSEPVDHFFGHVLYSVNLHNLYILQSSWVNQLFSYYKSTIARETYIKISFVTFFNQNWDICEYFVMYIIPNY